MNRVQKSLNAYLGETVTFVTSKHGRRQMILDKLSNSEYSATDKGITFTFYQDQCVSVYTNHRETVVTIGI